MSSEKVLLGERYKYITNSGIIIADIMVLLIVMFLNRNLLYKPLYSGMLFKYKSAT